jgi:flagellar protein FlbD
MIAIHRISHPEDDLLLNPDLVLTVEANPDTVITLINGSRLVVGESPEEVAGLVRAWRASILAQAAGPTAAAAATAAPAAVVLQLSEHR